MNNPIRTVIRTIIDDIRAGGGTAGQTTHSTATTSNRRMGIIRQESTIRRPTVRQSARTASAVIGATAIVAALGGCGGPDTTMNAGGTASGDNDSATSISFMLDWTPNTNHIGLYVAQQLGYYKDAGVDVTILPTAQAGAETSVENGVADAGFTTLSNVAAFDAQGTDLTMVFDLTQKQTARWCALASRTDITTPKDLDGKTFVSFGSAEQSAVVTQMIKDAGGSGEFKTATAGTNTFETLTSGKGDFGGFYATWEGVESELNGPALNCFVASDWGVPGNPDQLGFAVRHSWLDDADHAATLRKFLAATRKGYDYALANPDKAADLLVDAASTAQLDTALVRASMQEIIRGRYWVDDGDDAVDSADSGSADGSDQQVTGIVDFDDAQPYLDFQYQAGTYQDANGKNPAKAPQATDLATNDYLG